MLGRGTSITEYIVYLDKDKNIIAFKLKKFRTWLKDDTPTLVRYTIEVDATTSLFWDKDDDGKTKILFYKPDYDELAKNISKSILYTSITKEATSNAGDKK